jgi:hypothetical protein
VVLKVRYNLVKKENAMSADLIFSLCSSAILPGWLLLVFAPKWKWATGFITSVLIPFMLGLVYIGLFISQADVMPQGGGFGSPQELAISFSNPYLLTAGWIHYLAFDLFVGTWEVTDAQKQGINHWLVVPCLFFTLMLGPAGFALYLLLRFFITKQFFLQNA